MELRHSDKISTIDSTVVATCCCRESLATPVRSPARNCDRVDGRSLPPEWAIAGGRRRSRHGSWADQRALAGYGCNCAASSPASRRPPRPQHGSGAAIGPASCLGNGIRGVGPLRPNPHHRRARLVVLTEGGKEAYQAANARQAPWANQLASDLHPNDIEAATRLVRTLRARLEDGVAARKNSRA
jgi:hypothetical protein